MHVCQKRIFFSIILMLTLSVSTSVLAQLGNQGNLDYIGGPWIYTSVPCNLPDCDNIDTLNIDFLSRYTDKRVAEINFAKGKSKPKEVLFLGGRLAWHAGFLGGRHDIFTDNIGHLVDGVGLDIAGNNNDVFYGIIVLNVNKSSEAIMQLGYNDYAKIWLNGEVVYESEEQMFDEAEDMVQRFSVRVHKGKNLLMAKVVEGIDWNLFININTNFTVSYRMRNGKIIIDEILPVESSASTVSTRWASIKKGDRF